MYAWATEETTKHLQNFNFKNIFVHLLLLACCYCYWGEIVVYCAICWLYQSFWYSVYFAEMTVLNSFRNTFPPQPPFLVFGHQKVIKIQWNLVKVFSVFFFFNRHKKNICSEISSYERVLFFDISVVLRIFIVIFYYCLIVMYMVFRPYTPPLLP